MIVPRHYKQLVCRMCNEPKEPDYFTIGGLQTQICEECQNGLTANLIECDDGTVHCRECVSPSQDDYRGIAMPEGCKDDQCDCHNPIIFQDADGTPSTFEVKDGIIVEAK